MSAESQLLSLPGRTAGRPLAVRDLAGPAGAPTVVLLHGWGATADMTFHHCYRPLAAHARVVAFDQRGHGAGLRSRRPFRLADCADDIIAVADALDVDHIVPIGYSMGGAVAQLVWRRHRDRVDGLVLCATAMRFGNPPIAWVRSFGLAALAAAARVTPAAARRRYGRRAYLDGKRGSWEPWAIDAAAENDWRAVLEAGAMLGAFRSESWAGAIDVPTAVVVPEHDHVVAPSEQRRLAAAIPGARLFTTDGDHLVAATSPGSFVPVLLEALDSVIAPAAPGHLARRDER